MSLVEFRNLSAAGASPLGVCEDTDHAQKVEPLRSQTAIGGVVKGWMRGTCALLLMAVATLPNHADAYRITAILVASNIKTSATDPVPLGAEKSAADMGAFLSRAAAKIGAEYAEVIVNGNDFSWRTISDKIRTTPISADDTFLLYYAGHGAHPVDDLSEFPSMYVPDAGGFDYKSQKAIGDLLKARGARLSVVIFDSCNILVRPASGNPQETEFAQPGEEDYNVVVISSLTKMFGNARGQILIAGQREGDFSYFDVNGGKFTQRLLHTFLDSFAQSDYGWDYVLMRAKKEFEVKGITAIQRPINMLNLTAN